MEETEIGRWIPQEQKRGLCEGIRASRHDLLKTCAVGR
jgi:hypothetical protein